MKYSIVFQTAMAVIFLVSQSTLQNEATPQSWGRDESNITTFLTKIGLSGDHTKIVALRLISMKKKGHCTRQTPRYNHCKSFTAEGQCKCWPGFNDPPVGAAGKCDDWKADRRRCVREDDGFCVQCVPGYYLLNGSTENETHDEQYGCRMGSEQCDANCPNCKSHNECAVKKTKDAVDEMCDYEWKDSPTSCFQCKNGYELGSDKKCHEMPTGLVGCELSGWDETADKATCERCRPEYNAVYVEGDETNAAKFTCELVDHLDENYHSCMIDHPSKTVYEKWYQVIVEMNTVPGGEDSEWYKARMITLQNNKWWNTPEKYKYFTKKELSIGNIDQLITECRSLVTDEQHDFSKPETVKMAKCKELLASYSHNGKEPLEHLAKIYYRGIISMHRQEITHGDKHKVIWQYDRDYFRRTLMWSQVGIYGPWLEIPHGCPSPAVSEHKIVQETECEYYTSVGREIQSVANFASFTGGEDNDENTSQDLGLASILNAGTEGTTPTIPIAKCLLKKIRTVRETKNVQCFFDGMVPETGKWTNGVPDGMTADNIIDCKYMMTGHQHGKVCYQTIQQKQDSGTIYTACNDFIDTYPSAKYYAKCYEQCSNSFKHGFETSMGNDVIGQGFKGTPMTFREQMKSLTGDVSEWKGDTTKLLPGSYSFCQLNMWNSWSVCEPVLNSDKYSECSEDCGMSGGKFELFQEAYEIWKNKASTMYGINVDDASTELGDQRYNLTKAEYETVLNQTRRKMGARTHLEGEVLATKAAIDLEQAKTGGEDYSPDLLTGLQAELAKIESQITKTSAEMSVILANWVAFLQNKWGDSDSQIKECPRTPDPVTVTGLNFANWVADSASTPYSCGNGSGSNDETRKYCSVKLPYCCNKQGNGVCHYNKKESQCEEWNISVNDMTKNAHFSHENSLLCDIKKITVSHEELWNSLYDVYYKLKAFLDCQQKYGESPIRFDV